MRTVFFGTPELAVPSLAAVAERHEVVAVVCQPDRPQGRSKTPQPPPTKKWAAERGIPVHQPQKLNDGAFESWLKSQKPDACPLAAYGRILKQPILDIPTFGFINMHPSLLPLYRGPSPIQSALLNGETETGITIMRLTLDMDAGDIVLQEGAAISPDDNAATLTERLAKHGGRLIADALDRIAAAKAAYVSQDHAKATYCHLIEKRDGHIDWNKPASVIHNLVRAANPWPGAQTMFNGEVCRLLKSAVFENSVDAPAGEVVRSDRESVTVATGLGSLVILEFQAPGKKPMPMSEFLKGHAIKPGDRFESIP